MKRKRYNRFRNRCWFSRTCSCYILPRKNFLLVDSVKKKIAFINEVIETLDLKNVKTSTDRAEDLIKYNREKFDLALCRGVANLRVILEYMIPFLKVNARFLPQKLNENEIEESKQALSLLNSKIVKVHSFKLPIIKDYRFIFEIKKYAKTNLKYPRKVGILKKSTLERRNYEKEYKKNYLYNSIHINSYFSIKTYATTDSFFFKQNLKYVLKKF